MYRERLLAYSLFIALQIITGLLFLTDTTSGTGAALDGVPLDDTWIHFVYARNLAQRGGFYYNPGVPEAGETSPLWAIVLSIPLKVLTAFDVGPVAISKALGLLFAIGLSIVVYHLVHTYTGSYLASLLAGILIALDPTLSFSKVSGMEVTLFAFLMLLALLLYIKGRSLACGVALGFSVLARPEGYLLVGVVLLTSALGLIRKGHSIDRGDLKRLASLVIPLVVIILPMILFYFSVNGTPFPNTFHAKHTDLGFFNYDNLRAVWPGYLRRLTYFSNSAWLITLPLLLVGTVVGFKKEGALALPLLIFPWAVCYGLSVTLPMGSGPWNFSARRYLDPAIPFLVIVFVVALCKIWRQTAEWLGKKFSKCRFKSSFSYLLATPIALLFLLMPAKEALSLWRVLPGEYSWNCRNINDVSVALGYWVNERTPPGALVAVGDAGAIRYFGRREVLDLVGLNSHEVLGRSPFDLIRERRADYIIVFPSTAMDGWPYAERIYEISIDHNTILHGSTMVVYKTNWTPQMSKKESWYQMDTEGMELIDSLDVGDPADEASHDYSISEEKPAFARMFKAAADVTLLDDGWAYTGEESFTVASIPGRDLIVAKRYDTVVRGRVKVHVDDVFVGEWEFPERQFQFGEDVFIVPASFITEEQTTITFQFVPGSSIDINSFYYWIFVSRS